MGNQCCKPQTYGIDDEKLLPVSFRQFHLNTEYVHMEFPNLIGECYEYTRWALESKFPNMKIIPIKHNDYQQIGFDPDRIYLKYDPDTMEITEKPING